MANTPDFSGLRVASLESRKGDEMARMIERFGGVPCVSASMREVPLDENPAAVDFGHRLITGEIDIVIFMTGVGFKHLLAAVENRIDRQRYLNALSDMVTIARGPKPVAAMKEVGVSPSHRIPEPNTWREVLTYIDANVVIANHTVGVQEYGKANPSLIAGLEARGANVVNVKVYQYDLPVDQKPLEENVRAIVAGERDVIIFTSAHQVANLLLMAERLHLEPKLREAMRRMVVASVGPTTSEMLRDCDLPVDVEPEHPKMGPLVMAAAEKSRDLLERKRRSGILLASHAENPSDPLAPWYNSPFLKACRREEVPFTPVWLMRQAGRYMKEYREVRSKTTFLELCKNPRLCSEVMCTAVDKLGVDAAIIFSDLLPILEPMGMDLEFAYGEGPVIHNPIREAGEVDRLVELQNMDELEFVVETVRQTRRDLPEHIPLIGFAGAPFTLASYAIEGGSSRNYLFTKTLMYGDPGAWDTLMQRFARSVSRYLNAQIAAGAQAVQIFDSWVGCLGADDYRRFVLPYMKQMISEITPGAPIINFATGNPELLPLLSEGGGDVIGVDWRIRLDEAWKRVGPDKAVQGNMDPAILLTTPKAIRARVKTVLDQAGGRPGHIFNLGHGVLQQTPVEHAMEVVRAVHELSRR